MNNSEDNCGKNSIPILLTHISSVLSQCFRKSTGNTLDSKRAVWMVQVQLRSIIVLAALVTEITVSSIAHIPSQFKKMKR